MLDCVVLNGKEGYCVLDVFFDSPQHVSMILQTSCSWKFSYKVLQQCVMQGRSLRLLSYLYGRVNHSRKQESAIRIKTRR